jgi:hypothetical protein
MSAMPDETRRTHKLGDTRELRMPRESMTMVGIAFTKELTKKILAAAKKLQADGLPADEALLQLKRDHRGFSDAGLRRMLDLAAGRPVRDDFGSGDVVAQRAVSKDTFLVQLGRERSDLAPGGVVRFLGADWYVKRVAGALLELRRMV